MTNRTYHVGEDFPHLISGIRAVDEAVAFLELRHGDRIGHATAIGINPEYWLNRMPDRCYLEVGCLLDDLVFSLTILDRNGYEKSILSVIQRKILELSRLVYGYDVPTEVLERSRLMRHLDARYLDEIDSMCLGLQKEMELAKLRETKNMDPEAFKLFELYHAKETVIRYKAITPFETKFLPADVLRSLQRFVMSTVMSQQIFIEVMLTSNVRISMYDDYDKHHLWEWLSSTGDGCLRESKPTVVLCSDDPGIFSCSMRIEAELVYQMLTKNKTNNSYAEQTVREILERANEKSFGPCQLRQD